MAGVGICGPIVTRVSSFAILVGVGGAPPMSIRMGQKNENGARQILANCFLMLTVLRHDADGLCNWDPGKSCSGGLVRARQRFRMPYLI